MKAGIKSEILINSIEELISLNDEELNDFEKFIILNNFKAYQYFRTATEGIYQPTGNTGNTGWWKDNTSFILKKELKSFNDEFVFSSSTYIEIININYFYYMYSNDIIDIEGFRNKLKEFVSTISEFTGKTESDQKILISANIFPTGITTQEIYSIVNQFYTDDEFKILKRFIWEAIPIARLKRYKKLKIRFGEFEENGYITKEDIVIMWDDTIQLINEWIDTPSIRFYDWIQDEGEFTLTGFSSKTYYNSNIKDQMIDVIIKGIY